MRRWSLILTAAVAALGIVGEFRSPINGDVAWLLHAAGRMIDGDRLYVDLLETNPPLVVWLKLPIVAAARLAGASPFTLYRLSVLALALWSTAACALLLARAVPDPRDPARSMVPLAIALVLFVLPAPFFGQREHLALMLVLPYLVAVAGCHPERSEGAETRHGLLRFAQDDIVAVAAAIGFAIKPPFLVVWVAVVAYALLRRGEPRRRIRGMDVGIAAGLAVYAVAVAVLTPEFLRLAGRLGEPFLEYSRRPVFQIVTRNVFSLTAILALVLYFSVRRAVRHVVLADHLAMATAGFLLAVVVQGKGYGYHYLPALGATVVLLAVVLSGAPDSRRPLLRAAAVVCSALLLVGDAALPVQATASRAAGTLSAIDREMVETADFVRLDAAGAQVAVFSTRLADAFPMVIYADADWALRFPNLWFVQVYGRRAEPEALTGVPLWSVRTVAEDLERRKPALILVRRPDTGGELDGGLDYLAFLDRDEGFRRQFSSYRKTGDFGAFFVYKRAPGDSSPEP